MTTSTEGIREGPFTNERGNSSRNFPYFRSQQYSLFSDQPALGGGMIVYDCRCCAVCRIWMGMAFLGLVPCYEATGLITQVLRCHHHQDADVPRASCKVGQCEGPVNDWKLESSSCPSTHCAGCIRSTIMSLVSLSICLICLLVSWVQSLSMMTLRHLFRCTMVVYAKEEICFFLVLYHPWHEV